MSDDLIERRKRAAERFPESLTDTMGRQHPNIVRRGIMSGQFDNGSLVKGDTK